MSWRDELTQDDLAFEYVPSPDDIDAMTAKIRSEWHKGDRRTKRRQRLSPPVEIAVIDTRLARRGSTVEVD